MQRTRALSIFKRLHRTCEKVFKGDVDTLKAAHLKINEEFRTNHHITDPDKIEELIKLAEDSELLLRTTIVQMEYQEDKNTYKLNLREDLAYQDNEHCTTTKIPSSSPCDQNK